MAPAGGAMTTHPLALLESLSGTEVLVILIVALVVLGPERLPQMARQMGQGIHKLRVMARNLSSEMGDVLNDPAMEPFRELGELATRPKEKLLEYAREAEQADEEARRREAEAAMAAEVAELEARAAMEAPADTEQAGTPDTEPATGHDTGAVPPRTQDPTP